MDDNSISFGEYEEVFYGPFEEEMSDKPENVKCPNCGGEMISRTGKYGIFWGCKKFPECKGTRDSMGRSKQDRENWKAEQLVAESKEWDNEESPDNPINRFRFNDK